MYEIFVDKTEISNIFITFAKTSTFPMTIISLFSGAGGLDLGMVEAGHDVVWANDFDKWACETYRHNIGDHIVCADIKDIRTDDIPEADVVIGGFPCQGFSMANMRRSAGDERNQLYRFFYNTIKAKQPKFFIAENVKGILSLDGGKAIKRIVADFEEAGFQTQVNLVNMADYGVPQTRQRVIILGQHKDLGDQQLLTLPPRTHSNKGEGLQPWVTIKEALAHFPEPDTPNDYKNHIGSDYKISERNFTGHRRTDPAKPSPTILARGNGGGGVVAIPHYNGQRRLTIRESAAIQTFPDDFEFFGSKGACYRQIGNAVPVRFAKALGEQLKKIEKLWT